MAEQPPLPRLALRDVGLRGVAAARAELERAKAVAARNRLRQGKENKCARDG